MGDEQGGIKSFLDENFVLICGLLTVLLTVVIGWIVLTAIGKTVPEGFSSLATAIVGGFIGYLVPKKA